MPVSGYYEWQDTPTGKKPWYFTAREGSPILTIAGLWDEWKNRETGERLKSCAMIITEPNQFVAEVHDRMPVLLNPDASENGQISPSAAVRGARIAASRPYRQEGLSKRGNSAKIPPVWGSSGESRFNHVAVTGTATAAPAKRVDAGSSPARNSNSRLFAWVADEVIAPD